MRKVKCKKRGDEKGERTKGRTISEREDYGKGKKEG